MALRSKLVTSASGQKPKSTSRPITTNDKVAKAKAQEAKSSKRWRPSSPSLEGAPSRVSKTAPKVTKSTAKKPLTTKEKLQAADAAKKVKSAGGNATEAPKGGRGIGSLGEHRAERRGMLAQLRAHAATSTHFSISKRKKQGQSVLFRPTERTKRTMSALEAEAKSKEKAKKKTKTNDFVTFRKEKRVAEEVQPFRILDLPAKIQSQILKEAVVYPSHFVWPDSTIGQEQPDLAMTCRTFRNEILPMYYRENTFALDLSGRTLHVNVPSVNSPSPISKWACALSKSEGPHWFSHVRKWAFSYTPTIRSPLLDESEDDESFVVSVVFCKQDEGTWAAKVEVHRDARCMLPVSEKCGKCVLKQNPTWLNQAVIQVVDAAGRGSITGRSIVQLARAMTKKLDILVDLRCTEALR